MTNSPKVSVLIPTYNYANFLDEAIESVLAQTFTDFELIIVDNCSTDNTSEVVKKYLADKRISFYINETNLGLVGNWNKCLEYARGEYVKFLCADDKFYPQLLEKFVAVMEQYGGVSIVTSYSEQFGSRNFCRISPFKGYANSQLVRQNLLGVWNNLRNPSCVMFRMADVKKTGKFNPQLLQLTDREYYMRILTLGDCYVIPEPLSCVRSHGVRQSAINKQHKYKNAFERYRFMTSVKANTPQTDPMCPAINAALQRETISCAAIMYKLLPKIYKKENRELFKSAFQISYSEGALFAPLSYYLKPKYVKKLIGKA